MNLMIKHQGKFFFKYLLAIYISCFFFCVHYLIMSFILLARLSLFLTDLFSEKYFDYSLFIRYKYVFQAYILYPCLYIFLIKIFLVFINLSLRNAFLYGQELCIQLRMPYTPILTKNPCFIFQKYLLCCRIFFLLNFVVYFCVKLFIFYKWISKLIF